MASVPAQPIDEIEKEIVGDLDEDDDGAPSISREQAKKVGAVNAPAVQNNRRRQTVLERKRDGEKGVPWGEEDACLLYDDIIAVWPAQQIITCVKRTTGSQTSWYLRGLFRNGMELYDGIRKQCHGISPEAEYLVIFRAAAGREERGRGRVVMPSTEFDTESAPATGVPREVAPPPQAAPQPAYGGGYGAPPPPPPPATTPAAPPPGSYGDTGVAMAIQRQLSEIAAQNEMLRQQNEELRRQMATGQRPPPPVPVPNAPPPPVVVMPAPAAPQPVQPAPVQAPAKVPEIPPGFALTTLNGMAVLVPMASLGLGGAPAAAAPAAVAAAPAAPPAPPRSPIEQFGDAIGIVRSAVNAAHEIQSILPQASAPVAAAGEASTEKDDDDSPTKIQKMGDVNVVTNVEDGSVRLVDTAIANAPAIFSWLEKQKAEFQSRQGGGAPASQQPQGDMGPPPIPGR